MSPPQRDRDLEKGDDQQSLSPTANPPQPQPNTQRPSDTPTVIDDEEKRGENEAVPREQAPTAAHHYTAGMPTARHTLEPRRGRSSSQTSPPSHSISSDSSLSLSSLDLSDKEDLEERPDMDGHRPCLQEMRLSNLRSRRGYRRASEASGQQHLDLTPQESHTSLKHLPITKFRAKARPVFQHPCGHKPTGEDVIVDFDGPHDPYKPINWPIRKKVITTLVYGFITMGATWASASYSAGTRLVAEEFHVGLQTATLGTSLFLMGFGIGPLLWAPLSEVYGRRVAVLIPMFISMCFVFGSAVAKDLHTLMITRFWSAFFSSAPVTNTGGVLGDLYSAEYRAIGIAGYALAVVGGPALGMHSSYYRQLAVVRKANTKQGPSYPLLSPYSHILAGAGQCTSRA